jgi:3-oxoacyl-[acyl-carrier protein] reductase
MKLEGKVAIVTGGSRGLGPAICAELAAHGALVYVGYRRREREAMAVVEAIRADSGRAEPLALDVRDAANADAAIASAIIAQGRIDILVCSAGVHHDGWLATMPLDAWSDVLRTNLDGAMHCARAVLRPMMAQRSGSIVALSSVAGMRASPGQTNYAASKGGLIAFVSSLAAEVARNGIRVNAVVPGIFDAGMAARMSPDANKKVLAHVPMGRAGRAAELARAVLFLASDDASYVTGQSLVVDGGLCA